jgi:uncharacterized RmlC-like cupin family protein
MTNATAATVESEFARRVAGPRTMSDRRANPTRLAEKPTCRAVRAGAEFVGRQGHLLAPGISAQSAGAQRIHLQIATIPPGVRSNAHKHADHESAIYVLSGGCAVWYGEKLERRLELRAGDFLYIPADMPHLPYNPNAESCVVVVARTDPDEQESVVLLPELDAVHGPLPGEKRL